MRRSEVRLLSTESSSAFSTLLWTVSKLIQISINQFRTKLNVHSPNFILPFYRFYSLRVWDVCLYWPSFLCTWYKFFLPVCYLWEWRFKCLTLALLQNLREAIATYRNSILHQADEMKRAASLSFFVEYLERYYFLICFTVYLHTEGAAANPNLSIQYSFADWMRARPELYSILRRYLYYGKLLKLIIMHDIHTRV